MAINERTEDYNKKRMSTLSIDDSYTRIILPNSDAVPRKGR